MAYRYFVPNDVTWLLHKKCCNKPLFRRVKLKYENEHETVCFNGKDSIIRYRPNDTTAHILCKTQREANQYAKNVIKKQIELYEFQRDVLISRFFLQKFLLLVLYTSIKKELIMYHNEITSKCITKEETPLSYAMFHDLVFNTKRERVVMTPETFADILILNYVDTEIAEYEQMKLVTEQVFKGARFYGCVAREDSHSVQLWHDRITIYKPNMNGMFGEKYQLSRINWSAIGETTIEEAELFAKIMLEATHIAKKLNEDFLDSIDLIQ